MTLGGHLRELRKRVLYIAIGLGVGAILGWIFYDPAFDLIARPIRLVQDERVLAQLNFAGVAAPFDMKVKVSLFVGAIVTSPWWAYQLWAFAAPGMRSKEKRYAIGYLAAAVPLFLAGASLAYFVLPNAVRLFTAATPAETLNIIDAAIYMQFVMQFVLIFGVAFLLPLLMVALSFMGVVRGRTWRKGWRWAIVGIFTFAALATPTPDAISMIVMAIPICGLYGVALLLCVRSDKRRDAREAARDAEYGLTPSADASGTASAG